MNWPEAVERSSAHFANAYLWHDILTEALGWTVWGLAVGIGLAIGGRVLKFCLSAMVEAELKSQGPGDPITPPPTTGSAARRS